MGGCRSVNILIVDQEISYAKAIRNAVARAFADVRVWHADNVDTALDTFRRQQAAANPLALSAGIEELQHSETSLRIDVVIVNWEDLGKVPTLAIKAFFAEIAEYNSGKDFIRLVSMYDQIGFTMKMILSNGVTDVIFKPFDELLFLQKLLVQFPGLRMAGTSGFLYTARTSFKLELGGEYSIIGISESGFEIKHRAPIALGRKMKMYCENFGPLGLKGLYAVANSTVPSADESYLVSGFSFFGLTNEQLKHFRNLLAPFRKIQGEPERRGNFRQIRPRQHGLDPDRPRRVILIDFDSDTESALRQMLERNMQDYVLDVTDSYNVLMRELDPLHVRSITRGLSNQTEWEPFDRLVPTTLMFHDQDFSLRSVFPSTRARELLGYPLAKLQTSSDGWWHLVHPLDYDRVRELLQYAAFGTPATIEARFINANQNVHYFKLKAELSVNGEVRQIALALEDLTDQAIELRRSVDNTDKPFTDLSAIVAVILNYGFVRSDPDAAIRRLREALTEVTGRDNTPVFLLAPEGPGEIQMHELLQDQRLEVDDVFYKPVDRSYFIRKVRHTILKSLGEESSYAIDSFMKTDGWIDIARSVKAVGLGEYGLEVEYPTRVPVGAWGHFYLPELIGENGRGILGRCIRSEALEHGGFKIVFMFLAIKEEMLMKLRLFIKRFAISESRRM